MVIKVPDLLQQKGSYLQGFLEFTINISDNQSERLLNQIGCLSVYSPNKPRGSIHNHSQLSP